MKPDLEEYGRTVLVNKHFMDTQYYLKYTEGRCSTMRFFIVKTRDTEAKIECEGTWPQNKEQALELSIVKWETMLQGYKDDPSLIHINNQGTWTCALCRLYGAKCDGCPVDVAGYRQCKGTPYEGHVATENRVAAMKFAEKEIEFLKSLREGCSACAGYKELIELKDKKIADLEATNAHLEKEIEKMDAAIGEAVDILDRA